MRAAASSMASGRPSRRWQISATAGAVTLSIAKSGRTACARSMKSRTASYCVTCSSVGGGCRRGRVSGTTGNSRSARMCNGTRLVTRNVIPGQASRSWVSSDPAPVTCSKLSSTRSVRFSASSARRKSMIFASPAGRTRSTDAMASGTRSGSTMAASSTNQTPSGKSSCTRRATCIESRVLPIPPGPVRVTRRVPGRRTSSATAVVSFSRPRNAVGCTGRLCAYCLHGAQRREVLLEVGVEELEELAGLVQVLQPLLAQIAQANAPPAARPRSGHKRRRSTAPGRRARRPAAAPDG